MAPSVVAGLAAAVADQPVPADYAQRPDASAWIGEMSRRLAEPHPDARSTASSSSPPSTTRRRAQRSIPSSCSRVIHHESAFRKYAISSAEARGYMQVMPFWTRLIGTPEQNLFHLRTNLRYGCTILRHYLEPRERRRLSRARALQRQPRPPRVSDRGHDAPRCATAWRRRSRTSPSRPSAPADVRRLARSIVVDRRAARRRAVRTLRAVAHRSAALRLARRRGREPRRRARGGRPLARAHRGRRRAAHACRVPRTTSSRRSRATASRGTAPLARQSGATARYAAALERLRAAGVAYPCACTRRELADAPMVDGERVYPATAATASRRNAPARAQRSWRVASATRASRSSTACRAPQSQVAARRGRRLRRAARRRPLRLPARRRRRRCGATASPRSCAAPTCSRRRRGRSCCSACSALPTPTYLHVPVAIDAHGREAVEADGRARARRRPARRAARGVALPRPARAARRLPSVAAFWAHALRAWSPARVPRVLAQRAPP